MTCAVAAIFSTAARAQEGEAKIVDAVVARVNGAVILKSAYERAQQELLDDLKQRGLKDAELEKQFNEIKPMILDQLIDSELLVQRGKELSLDVEPQVNQQLLRIMKDNNLQSLEDLEVKMREVGVDIGEVKRLLRTRFMSDAVRGRDVFSKIFFKLTEKEKRDYYEQHKQSFAVPGEVTLSRIFINAGKDEASALARAKDIASQAKSGVADFAALARRYSEEELGKKGGLIGSIKLPDLSNEVRTAIGDRPKGTVTDPIKLDSPNAGFAIFRVDERKDAEVRSFDEKEIQEEVAQRLTYERGATEMDKYLEKLRADAFIEVDPRYQLANSKIKSAQIKRVPYSEDNKKKKKDDENKKKEDAEKAAKAATPKQP
jgi:PPIC-type PPIASE domain/SurA-like N-terminal domain